jgi:hypothetical protein
MVVIDGDEYQNYKCMKKQGLIDTEQIEAEYTPDDPDNC